MQPNFYICPKPTINAMNGLVSINEQPYKWNNISCFAIDDEGQI